MSKGLHPRWKGKPNFEQINSRKLGANKERFDHNIRRSELKKSMTPLFEFKHKEAFCAMHYHCGTCNITEIIWNSRDGVTPSMVRCNEPGCDGVMKHIHFNLDAVHLEYNLLHNQRYFRDGTIEDAMSITKEVYDRSKKDMLASGHFESELEWQTARGAAVVDVRMGEGTPFPQGWPKLDTHTINPKQIEDALRHKILAAAKTLNLGIKITDIDHVTEDEREYHSWVFTLQVNILDQRHEHSLLVGWDGYDFGMQKGEDIEVDEITPAGIMISLYADFFFEKYPVDV
ncbi:MAG: hypothetical protein OEX12_11275 [Gammaproteobacteria bacterium]|nr:hypothetical protein [Gammaproteobacteria bacterium]